MGVLRRGRSRAPWALLPALAALLLSAPALSRAEEDLDPEEDPALKVPDVGAIDLATMANNVDASDENWEAVEAEVPTLMAEGKLRAVLKATRGSSTIIVFALRAKTALLIDRELLKRLRTLRETDPTAFNVLVERNDATARLIDRMKTKTVVQECAAAYGHLDRLAAHMIVGEKPDLVQMKACVAVLLKHEATLKVTLDEWKEIVLPALQLGQRIGDRPLTDWAVAELGRLTKGKDQEPDVHRLLLLLELDKGTRLIATKPAEALPILEKVFAELSPADAIPFSDLSLLYAYNSAISAAKLAGLPIKADYKMKEVNAFVFSCKFPLALGWRVDESGGGQVLSLGRGGGPTKGAVSLTADQYQAGINYTAEDGRVLDGDSIFMITKDRLKRLKTTLSKVLKEPSVVAAPNQTLAVRSQWELVGLTKEGKPIRIREWGFKVGRISDSFLLMRITETNFKENDPEVALVLGSLVEAPVKK